MLGHIYYVIGLIPMLMALAILTKLREFNRVKIWKAKFEEITKRPAKKEDFRSIEEYNTFAGVNGIMIIDFIWIVLGLLTGSWYIFLSLISVSIIVNFIRKAINLSIVSNILFGILLITKFLVYLYLIINHFHLHYDTWELIKNYLQ